MYLLQYRLDNTWEAPGDPRACQFDTLNEADTAGDDLLEQCPEYRTTHVRVIDASGEVLVTWAPATCELT